MRFALHRLGVAAALVCGSYGPVAHAAELRIFSPRVEQGRVDVENNSAVTFDRSADRNRQQTHFGEIGYGMTDFWRTEIEGHWESDVDGLRFRTLDNENIFQLLSSERHWLDAALLEEWDHAVDRRSPDVLTFGALVEKDVGASHTILNVFFDREFSRNATPGTILRYAGRSVWQLTPLIGAGAEFYGNAGRIGHMGAFDQQDHRLGPALAGELDLGRLGEIGYDVAYVFGLTSAAPEGTVVWRFEYGFRF